MSVGKEGTRMLLPPKIQADAVLDQTNPGSGTKYTVLDTTPGTRLISISAYVTWTVQPTPLEIHGTIDGITYDWSKTDPVNNTKYHTYTDYDNAQGNQPLTTAQVVDKNFMLEARSVKIEAEITGGTVSKLYVRAKYAKYE